MSQATRFSISELFGFAAEAADLGETGDARFHESADVVVRHQLGELIVVLDQVRTRADDAHVAEQHIPKLRDLIDAEFAEPFPDRINSFVAVAGPAARHRHGRVHGAEFVDR